MSVKSIYFSIHELLQRIDSSSARFAVLIGKNISFSLSPYIHSLICSYQGIRDLTYLIYDTKDELLNPSWKVHTAIDSLLKRNHLVGINITTPYKLEKYPSNIRLDLNSSGELITPVLKKSSLHSVNTLFKSEGKRLSTSTDMLGLEFSLKQKGYSRGISDFDSIVVFGSGGMSRAVVDYVKDYQNRVSIFFLSRTQIDILKICGYDSSMSNYSFPFNSESLEQILGICRQDKTLILNTVLKNVDTSWSFSVFKNIDPKQYTNLCFMDLNYDRSFDSVLEKERSCFKSLKIDFIDGIDMLIVQAILAQTLWNNLKLKTSDILDMVSNIRTKINEFNICQN